MDYLIYLIFRCDRRCDGKFGNFVGTKHTQRDNPCKLGTRNDSGMIDAPGFQIWTRQIRIRCVTPAGAKNSHAVVVTPSETLCFPLRLRPLCWAVTCESATLTGHLCEVRPGPDPPCSILQFKPQASCLPACLLPRHQLQFVGTL